MANPVVVEVLRGERVESAHRGSGAVVDADGRLVFAFGDVDRPVYPRSAVKALQALPLVESGAADTFALSRRPGSRSPAARMAGRSGTSRLRLRCSPTPGGTRERSNAASTGRSATTRDARSRKPGDVRRRCTTIVRASTRASSASLAPRGSSPTGYVRPDHPVQRAVTAALADVHRRAALRARRRRSTAARSPPSPFRSRIWRSASPALRRAWVSDPSGRGRRGASARRSRRPLGGCGRGPVRHRGHGAHRRQRLHQGGRRGRLFARRCPTSASGSRSRRTTAESAPPR